MKLIWNMAKMIKSTVRTIFHQIGRVPPISTFSRRWQGSAAILGYHRVIPDQDYSLLNGPYKDLSCCISTFENQLKFLRANYCLVSMNQLFEHIRQKHPGFVVALTMDDGYRDNYLYALPVLQRLDIPVTIYMTTRFLEGDTSMWWFDLWDELYGRDSVVSVVGDSERRYKTKSMRQKVSAYEKLRKVAMQLSETDLWLWLEEVKNNKQRRQYPNLVCDSDLLGRLCSNRLITIGCHSHSHRVLSLCTDSELREEFSLSKHILEEKFMCRNLYMPLSVTRKCTGLASRQRI